MHRIRKKRLCGVISKKVGMGILSCLSAGLQKSLLLLSSIHKKINIKDEAKKAKSFAAQSYKRCSSAHQVEQKINSLGWQVINKDAVQEEKSINQAGTPLETYSWKRWCS